MIFYVTGNKKMSRLSDFILYLVPTNILVLYAYVLRRSRLKFHVALRQTYLWCKVQNSVICSSGFFKEHIFCVKEKNVQRTSIQNKKSKIVSLYFLAFLRNEFCPFFDNLLLSDTIIHVHNVFYIAMIVFEMHLTLKV